MKIIKDKVSNVDSESSKESVLPLIVATLSIILPALALIILVVVGITWLFFLR